MRIAIVIFAALATVASCTECCYQFSGRMTVPRIVWQLGVGEQSVASVQHTGEFRLSAADSARALGQCSVISADAYQLEQALWAPLEHARVQRVFTVTDAGQLELGPLVTANGDRQWALDRLHGHTLRVGLQCQDRVQDPSCVLFDLLLRDTDAASVQVTLDTDTPRAACARSASPTGTPSPSHTRTPSATPSVTPTPAPLYGTIQRWTLVSGQATLTVEAGISWSAHTVHVCPALLQPANQTLVPAESARAWTDGTRKRHGVSVAQYYEAQAEQATRMETSVTWSNGGYCRFVSFRNSPAQLEQCRVYEDDGDREWVFSSGGIGETLPYQEHRLCQRELPSTPSPSASQSPVSSASPSPAPVTCDWKTTPDIIYQAHSVELRSLAEIALAVYNCSDGNERRGVWCASRLHRAGSAITDEAAAFDDPSAVGIVQRVGWPGQKLWIHADSLDLSGEGSSTFEMSKSGRQSVFSMIRPCVTARIQE